MNCMTSCFVLLSSVLVQGQDQAPQPPTRKQAEKVAKLIAMGQQTGDWTLFDKACDLVEHSNRVIGRTELSEPVRGLFRMMIQGDELIGPRNALRENIIKPFQVTFLRIRMVDGTPRPLFRTIDARGMGGYFEWILGASHRDEPRIVDAHMFASGMSASEFMRQLMMPPAESLKVLNSLRAPTPMDLMHSKERLTKMVSLASEGKHAEAWDYFTKNKRHFGKDKIAYALSLQISALVGAEAHVAAFEAFEEQFPGDSAIRFNRPGALRLAGKFDQAIEAVDLVDRELGGDPFLDVLRSTFHAEAGRMEKAAECAKRCTDSEPALAEGWYARVSLRLQEKDSDGAVLLLKEGDKVSTLDPARISALKGYEDLSKTEAYRAWLGSRRSK